MPEAADGQSPSTIHDGHAAAPSPSLRSLLDRLQDCPPSSLLTLLRADQRKRWQRGERVPAEVYLARLPALAAKEESVLDVVFSEVAVRQELGEQPTVDEYVRRFSRHEAALRRQFLLNAALDDADLFEAEPGHSTMRVGEPPVGDMGLTTDLPVLERHKPIANPALTNEPFETLPSTPDDGARLMDRKARRPLPSVPGYDIQSELGRGGMGVVYKARQIGLKRLVALKMILSGSHASGNELARLRSEAEAVAKLQHPNIVQIYEVGEQDGLPYLSLEFVEGGSLADQLDGTPLPEVQAAAIVEQLAQAMHYAHQQGIVHRDLKPANILMQGPTLRSLDPAARSQVSGGTSLSLSASSTWLLPSVPCPKITDFGLAKVMETNGAAGLTHSGTIVGTPSYMAPEQAAGHLRAIGPRTDVYALGAILYELLTGRPPFKAATAVDTIIQVMSEDPVAPSRLQPKVARDLENICLKCLHKEPPRRYESALALAEDLRAFRDNRPVSARPVGLGERVGKWARRNPAVAASLAAVLLVSVVGFALVCWKWREAQHAYGVATGALVQTEQARQNEQSQRLAKEDALREAEVNLYFNRIALAEREWSANDVLGVLKLLDNAPAPLRRWEWYYLRRLCHGAPLALPGKSCVAVSPDNRWIASGRERIVLVWDLATGKPVFTLGGSGGHTSRVNHVAFSADSHRLASVSDDGTARLWDLHTGKLERTLQATTDGDQPALLAVAFQPGGTLLAAASDDDTVRLWDTRTGKAVRVLEGHTDTVTSVAFSPDGRLLASASKDKAVRLWEAASGNELRVLRGHEDAVTCVAFGADGKLLVSASVDQTVKLWDPTTGQEVRSLAGHQSPVNSVAFSASGQLASGSGDFLKPGEIKTWDARTGRLLHTYRWPTQEITGLAFSSDGRRLASADAKSVMVWDAANDLESRALRAHDAVVMAVAFSPTGPFLASAGEDWSLKIWNVETEKVVHSCDGHIATINAVAYSPDGGRIVTASDDRTVKVWNSATGMLVHTLSGHQAPVMSVAVHPGGKILASAASSREKPGEVKLWDLETGKEIKTIAAPWTRTLAFSPDGKRLAGSADRPFRVVVWDLDSGREVFSQDDFRQWISSVVYSPDGRWLAASGGSKTEGIIRLWDVATGRESKPIKTRTGRVGSMAFSPDSQRIVAASWDQSLKLFDPQTGQDVLTLRGHTDGVTGVAFSADGWRIASSSKDKTVRLWNATPGR